MGGGIGEHAAVPENQVILFVWPCEYFIKNRIHWIHIALSTGLHLVGWSPVAPIPDYWQYKDPSPRFLPSSLQIQFPITLAIYDTL